MKLSMTGQEKGDLLIQVTAWADLTVVLPWYKYLYIPMVYSIIFQLQLVP
jgi:hypothetical protein